MKNRTTLFVVPVILLIFLFAGAALSQTRRPGVRSRNSSAQRLTPLTLVQKRTVSKFIDRAKSLELTYQINHLDYVTAAESFDTFIDTNEVKQLPEGAVKTYLVSMMYGYGDAGTLLGMLTHSGLKDAFYNLQEASGRNSRLKAIEDINARWHMNVLQVGLNQSQQRIFNNASSLKDKLISLLARTPTSEFTPSTESNEWIFPKPGMRGKYSDITKTTMYDLGDGVFASHVEIVKGVPAVAMFFLPNILEKEDDTDKEKVSDADLALAFASKVVKLPGQLSDTILNQEKDSEYRFRTASGKVLVVALTERKMAILRFE